MAAAGHRWVDRSLTDTAAALCRPGGSEGPVTSQMEDARGEVMADPWCWQT